MAKCENSCLINSLGYLETTSAINKDPRYNMAACLVVVVPAPTKALKKKSENG